MNFGRQLRKILHFNLVCTGRTVVINARSLSRNLVTSNWNDGHKLKCNNTPNLAFKNNSRCVSPVRDDIFDTMNEIWNEKKKENFVLFNKVPIRITISDPILISILDIQLPRTGSIDNVLELPNIDKADVIDPAQSIVEKKALNNIRIRRRKMKIHKKKKWLRKFKIYYQNLVKKRERKREKRYNDIIQEKLKSIKEFSAKKMILKTLEMSYWKAPQTRVRGLLAPDWVIEEDVKRRQHNKMLRERIDECLQKL